ncbi:hypothetical protein J6590_071285 [Homalodisca vitripennis]|nr:hypothetical protein J6590_071285 [Homalodisca vitripennis]
MGRKRVYSKRRQNRLISGGTSEELRWRKQFSAFPLIVFPNEDPSGYSACPTPVIGPTAPCPLMELLCWNVPLELFLILLEMSPFQESRQKGRLSAPDIRSFDDPTGTLLCQNYEKSLSGFIPQMSSSQCLYIGKLESSTDKEFEFQSQDCLWSSMWDSMAPAAPPDASFKIRKIYLEIIPKSKFSSRERFVIKSNKTEDKMFHSCTNATQFGCKRKPIK